MKKFKFLSVLLVLAFLFGCGITQQAIKEDPYKVSLYTYSEALKWYTENAETYYFHYSMANAETKAKWKEEISPKFLDFKDGLDAWKKAIDEGNPTEDYLTTLNRLRRFIISYGLSFLTE